MRLWSLHPKLLDRIGLVALWRETLLAKKVLLGETKGYKNHPQLERFKDLPITAINTYLFFIHEESQDRNYNFNYDKVGKTDLKIKIDLTDQQLKYEFNHLIKKLEIRDENKFNEIKNLKQEPHPIFNLVKGKIADWERV